MANLKECQEIAEKFQEKIKAKFNRLPHLIGSVARGKVEPKDIDFYFPQLRDAKFRHEFYTWLYDEYPGADGAWHGPLDFWDGLPRWLEDLIPHPSIQIKEEEGLFLVWLFQIQPRPEGIGIDIFKEDFQSLLAAS